LRAEAALFTRSNADEPEPVPTVWSDMDTGAAPRVRDAEVELALLAAKRGRSA
jgi:hypothetical protein